jgi:hypothetical protein
MRLPQLVLSLCGVLTSTVATASSVNGVYGHSGKQGVLCSQCHNPQATAVIAPSLTLLMGGTPVSSPLSVVAGTRVSFTVELTGGPGSYGGTNIATDKGTLQPSSSLLIARTNPSDNMVELTHGDKQAFASGKASWPFVWTAPALAGTATLWIAAQSVNGDMSSTGDQQVAMVQSITITPANQPPTVATPATAAIASPTTVTLNVLGADDTGESGLSYTWSAVGPAGAPAVTFSANGTHDSSTTTATIGRSGAYTFTARIADAQAGAVTSATSFSSAATYTRLAVTPPSRTLAIGNQLTLTTQAIDQFNQPMTAPTGTVSWSVPSGAGTITSSGVYTAPSAIGTYTVSATLSSKSGTSTITVVNGSPPTVAAAATAVPSGNTAFTVSVLGSDDGGEGLLKYTWAATTAPGAVTFSANNSNAAKHAVAQLSRAGAYTFTVTLTDAAGLSVTSTVSATVTSAFTSLAVTPALVTVQPLKTAQLTASALDQFSRTMPATGAVSWLSFGGGTLSASGEFQAGSTLGGPFEVRATMGGRSASAQVTIANNGIPVITQPPSATPAAVTSRTTRLRVIADDEAGEAGLKYRWEATGPSEVAFAPNDSNAAKLSTATFAQAGSYGLTVTVSNAAGKSASASFSVDVEATSDHLAVSPNRIALRPNAVQLFTVGGVDQFGDALTLSDPVDWSATAGAIDPSGLLHAVGTPGHYAVTASAGTLFEQAQVTIDAAPPTVSLLSPVSLTTIKGKVTLTAVASDNDVLAGVRFLVDGTEVGHVAAPPYQVDWDTVTATDGSHELKVAAEDAAGNRAETLGIEVEVWNNSSRPPPGPGVAQGQGCSSSAASLAPLGVLAVLGALFGTSRRRVTVSRAGQRGRDSSGEVALKPASARRTALGTATASRAARRLHMTRTLFAVTLLLTTAAFGQTDPQQRLRCAARLAANVLGTAPTSALLTATNPQDQVPALLQDPLFIDRFAGFIQSRFAPEPTPFKVEDAPFYLTRKILSEGYKWRDLYVGPFTFARQAGDTNGVYDPIIAVDAVNGGYGFFQSTDWRTRFRGNELEGYRIVHAYRILNNVLGIELKAALNTTGVGSDGRKSAQCAGCHYHPVFGLDLIARVLPKRTQYTTSSPPYDAPQVLVGGQTINNEKELLQALVASPDFQFNACRLAMRYAYGRPEYQCEGPTFDACMSAFASQETMQSALAAILRHPTYCQ